MDNYFEKVSELFVTENYGIFFEDSDEEDCGLDFERIGRIYFGFTYLKLIDSVLRDSKEDVMIIYVENKEAENLNELLLDAATYPNGEPLGFYNISEHDLHQLSEIISDAEACDKLLEYINGFSRNVREVFEEIEFPKYAYFLEEHNLLTVFIDRVCSLHLDMNYFSGYSSFLKLFEKFLEDMARDEFYSIGLDPIVNSDPESSYFHIRESIDRYGGFLNDILLSDANLKDKSRYNVYDPNSNGAYILHKTKDGILRVNPDAEISLFGKSMRNENRAIYLAKKSVSRKDPYEISDAAILTADEDILKASQIRRYGDFDFIVSNVVGCELRVYEEIIKEYADENPESVKSVLAIDKIDFIKEYLARIIRKDFLESLVSFSTHHILILNSSKSESRKGKFLFIDKSDILEEDGYKSRYQRDIYENDQFDLFNKDSSMQLSEFDSAKMDDALNLYQRFEDSYHSVLIRNEDYNDETLELLLF